MRYVEIHALNPSCLRFFLNGSSEVGALLAELAGLSYVRDFTRTHSAASEDQ